MSTGIQTFENEEFGKIRAIEINGEPWFVGKDVAIALGYKDSWDAIKKHVDKEDKQNLQNTGFESPRGLIVVNESGFYALVLSSKLKTARDFKRWVTREVLPSIRKGGYYFKPDSYMIADPVERAKRWIEEENFRLQLLAENQEMKPKADFYDAVANCDNLTSMGTVAKMLNKGLGRNKLFRFLRQKKVLMGWNLPYQKYVDRGYFKVIESAEIPSEDGHVELIFTTYVTQKGIDFIRKLLESE